MNKQEEARAKLIFFAALAVVAVIGIGGSKLGLWCFQCGGEKKVEVIAYKDCLSSPITKINTGRTKDHKASLMFLVNGSWYPICGTCAWVEPGLPGKETKRLTRLVNCPSCS